LNREFNFTLDPCASKKNAKCKKFYTKKEDGLSKDWSNEVVFCNPPYNRYTMNDWLKKMSSSEAKICVGLLPARTNTKWFHEYVWGKSEIRFIRGKLKFNGYKWQAPFPSMIVIFKS